MDRAGNLFWKRFTVLVILSIIAGVSVTMKFNWLYGLVTYLTIQWLSIPVLIRMSMND